MNTHSPTAYIMEDPREAMRLEVKVDPEAWVRKYLAHHVPPGAEILSVGCGSDFAGSLRDRFLDYRNRNRHQRRACTGSDSEKSCEFTREDRPRRRTRDAIPIGQL
jgi:hypothetical protein